jgi:hypothetical protein
MINNFRSHLNVGQIYVDFPILRQVKPILESVQNTENSTGNAQYQILKSPQPGKSKMKGPWMNTALNWSKLKNDPRLSAAQKKTIDKIVVSLQTRARDMWGNRPRINFDPKNMAPSQIDSKLRKGIANKAAAIGRGTSNNSKSVKPTPRSSANPVPNFPYGAGF